MDAEMLKKMFEESNRRSGESKGPGKVDFSPEEAEKFKKAFDDAEFRKMFSEYMDELQNPANREETEAYISQLESEQKVPAGKELIRPEPYIVVKSFKKESTGSKDSKGDKLFINIVQSSKIAKPTSTSTAEGSCWSLPYSIGPPHMEKDKHDVNAACFDCCFHPEAISLCGKYKEFKDLVINTAIDGVEESYRKQGMTVKLDREFHVVKGIQYKQGLVPAMLINTQHKQQWLDSEASKTETKAIVNPPPKGPTAASPKAPVPVSVPGAGSVSPVEAPAPITVAAASIPAARTTGAAPLAVKKGFLNSAKTSLYPETVKFKGSAATAANPTGDILLPSSNLAQAEPPAAAPVQAQVKAAGIQDLGEVKSTSREAPPKGSDSTREKEKQKPVAAGADLRAVSSSIRRKETAPSPAAPVPDTSPSSQPPVAAASSKAPSYTVKERGHVSMGDLEPLREKIASNRPSEIVYTIHLPLVSKASQVVLDVSERELKLSYADVYELCVNLPYPVFDTKGVAKFDKAAKTLTLTLPVKAQAVPTIDRHPPAQDVVVDQEKTTLPPPQESIVDAAKTQTRQKPDRTEKAVAAPKPQHSRWVAAATSEEGVAENKVGQEDDLASYIRTQAAQALKNAQSVVPASKSTPASVNISLPPAPPADDARAPAALNADPLGPPAADTAPFYASATYAGSRPGFVFKMDVLGLGYYRDQVGGGLVVLPEESSGQKAVEKSSSSSPGQDGGAVPIKMRQSRSALAMIVQVRYILKDTVEMRVTSNSVDISFEALESSDAAGPNAGGGGSRKRYTLGLDLLPPPPQEEAGRSLDPQQSNFDVADQNMAVVLGKGDACSEYWRTEECDKKATATSSEDIAYTQAAFFRLRPFRKAEEEAARADLTSSHPPEEEKKKPQQVGLTLDLQSALQSMHFSSGEALFDLD